MKTKEQIREEVRAMLNQTSPAEQAAHRDEMLRQGRWPTRPQLDRAVNIAIEACSRKYLR